MKKTYNSPVVEYTPIILESRICGESFTNPFEIGDPTDAGTGR